MAIFEWVGGDSMNSGRCEADRAANSEPGTAFSTRKNYLRQVEVRA
jgi:hypothetical protein